MNNYMRLFFRVIWLSGISVLAGCSSGEVSRASLLSIQIDPQSVRIAEEEAVKFNAIGTFDDLSTRDISAEVVWSSSDPEVATISPNGVATGVKAGGTSNITAKAGPIVSDPAALVEVVDSSNRLVSIQVEPALAQIQIGAARNFTATGTYLDNSVRDITTEVIWESTDPTVVSVSNAPGSKGLAIGLAAGTAGIGARLDDVSALPADVTVVEVALESIAVSPVSPTLPLGNILEFKATGTYSDSSTADLTRSVTWNSSNAQVAVFSDEPGREGNCSGLAEGTSTVTAVMQGVISNPVTLTVSSASLQNIAIEPAAPSVPVGTQVRFSATGTYSDGQVFDLSGMVTWHTQDDAIVAFDTQEAGLATALAEGSAEIWASLDDQESNRVRMTVSSATLESIELSSIPANPVIPVGQQIQFIATGHYSDQDTEDITGMVTWDSSDKSVASISNAEATRGLAMGIANGETIISATLGGITQEGNLQVQDIEIVALAITPSDASLPVGEHLQLTARATYSDGSEGEVTGIVTWFVGNDLVAAVDNAEQDRGRVTALAVGDTIIWCVSPNQVSSAPVPLQVTSATLSCIEIASATPSVVLGSVVEFTAAGRYSDGGELDLTSEVLWSSSEPAVASISNGNGTEGHATALSEGVTCISAGKDGIQSDPFHLEVVAPSLESIAVTPEDAFIGVGEQVMYTATGRYSDGLYRPITDLAYWQSSDTQVAAVSNAAANRGEARGVAAGTAAITASHRGVDSPAVWITVVAPTCNDGAQNQDETDIDCGGTVCGPCDLGQNCLTGSDCLSGSCDPVLGICIEVPPSCDDGIHNQDETDIDCGGSVCDPCANGQQCQSDDDCQSDNCDVGQSDTCIPPESPWCTDGVISGDETDLDCGGSCPPCQAGQMCQQHSDCVTGICDFAVSGTCIDDDPQYEVNEDFETGDFSKFAYEFQSSQSGGNHWEIENDPASCHAGDHCMRSSISHQLLETTSVTVRLSVRENTDVTFWARINTEPDQHYFRFYVDGTQKIELSGEIDWQLYVVPVQATGVNGPDRVLTWEFARSDYIDPNHPPMYQVWVDDIDMPDWNTEPSVPELIRPRNGKLTNFDQPTFEWRSIDPDFDTVTYEMHYDIDPAFPDPVSTGETNNETFIPPLPLADLQTYYWRVRAKDNSNYRWSDWSETWAVSVDTSYEYAAVWRQTERDQFEMDETHNLQINATSVSTATETRHCSRRLGPYTLSCSGCVMDAGFYSLPQTQSGTSGTVKVEVSGDYDHGNEFGTFNIEDTYLETFYPGACGSYKSMTSTVSNISNYVNDGSTRLSFDTSYQVDYWECKPNAAYFSLDYDYEVHLQGTIISTPVHFDLFEGKNYWEKVHIIGSGTITVQILDADGNPIPDSVIPGNSAGLSDRTIRLWDLEPESYPVIKLKATLEPGAILNEWVVVANDMHEWLFSNTGDREGWVGDDHNATPSVSVSNGVLRLSSGAAGDDPNIQYWFPQPVDANRFTTLEIRLRTSNTYNNDDVILFWDSNYGAFDARRSFSLLDQYLHEFRDLVFDLTVVPSSPNEPWQGQINAIRLDPVSRFLGQTGEPASGWFEIERIAIY